MRKSTEKGSVLISVLILVVIVALVMGAVASFITHGIQRTKATSSRLQALYLAEAGVEKAIEQLEVSWNNVTAADWVDFPSSPPSDKIIGQYSFEFPPDLQGTNKRVIKSSGTAGSETVTVEVKVSKSLLPKVMGDGIFANDEISLNGNASIVGPVNTNSTETGSISLGSNTGIDGDVNVGPGGDPQNVISDYDKVIDQITGEVGSLSESYSTPLPVFPEFPALAPGDLSDNRINADGSYDTINVKKGDTLTINVGSGTRRIRVIKSLSVDGEIILEGTGKLEFYIDKEFTIDGGINVGDNPSRLLLYYKGKDDIQDDIQFTGNASFSGSIYAKKASFSIGGSGKIAGNFVTGSDGEVKIAGNAWEYGVLYAPNATVKLTGDASLEGTIVANELNIRGATGGNNNEGSKLTFNAELVNAFPFYFSDFSSLETKIESWKQI